jgi:hypothetical protein
VWPSQRGVQGTPNKKQQTTDTAPEKDGVHVLGSQDSVGTGIQVYAFVLHEQYVKGTKLSVSEYKRMR